MRTLWLSIISLLVAISYYARHIEPNWQEVKRFSVTLPRLSSPFHKYRIGFISDIHIDGKASLRRLEKAMHNLHAAKPDLIAITGDFFSDHFEAYVDDLITILSQFHAPDGVIAVSGNHDHYHGRIAQLHYVLHAAGVTELNNQVHTIWRGAYCFHIAGVDDPIRGQARLDQVLEQIPPYGAAILLAHEPDYSLVAAGTRRFDMQLSGHTHGGQIRLPFLPPLRNVTLGLKFNRGFHNVYDNMYLYVTRGIGMVNKPLRFFSRPEVVIITLKSKKRQNSWQRLRALCTRSGRHI